MTRSTPSTRGDTPSHALLRSLHASCAVDPFVGDRVPVDSRAWALTWQAEMARLDGAQILGHWTSAASAWDRLTRPHAAAYCRWWAAEVALHERQGTVAARLLKRAATDAREHLPLSDAIAQTAARAPWKASVGGTGGGLPRGSGQAHPPGRS